MSKNKWNKYLPTTRYNNLLEMVLDTAKKFGETEAMQWFERNDGSIKAMSYNVLVDYIKTMFYWLNSKGLARHDHIAICSETSAEWVFADFGIQALGGVSVAVYPSLKPKEIEYIIKDSESKAIFVDTQENLKKVLSIEDEITDVKHVIVFELFDPSLKSDRMNVISFKQLIDEGVESYYRNSELTLFERSIAKIMEDDLASLIYTSGTTGVPKGTMLTHKNFLSHALAAVSVAMTLKKGIKPNDHNFLSIMPYSHSFGRCVGEYCPLLVGAKISIVSGYNPEEIRRAFEEFKPTIMCGIPYLFQKIYNIILTEVAKYPKKVGELVDKIIANGKEYFTNLKNGQENQFGVRFRQKSIGKIVGKIINKKLGGRWEVMISGSAALSEDLMFFFNTLGIPLIEGYGLTETSPVTHLLRTDYNSDFRPNYDKKTDPFVKAGTIGPPIEIVNNPYANIQQKLDPETGELLLKGPMVMKGYWKKPELTKVAFDNDGWLRTGDVAEIDDDGYVKIKGRSKVIIKLSTGKMISPAAVETLITPTSKIIAQIILVGGDSRKYLTAIIVPYQDPLKKYADENDIFYESWKDLLYNDEILNLIKEDINTFTINISEYSRPKKYLISCAPFTSERYVTPTYKFKRNAILKDLKEDIDKLYNIGQEFLIIEERITDFYDQSLIIT